MGAVGAIGAGVSLISGLSGINEKNRQAAAQAQAAADERYRAQASAWAAAESLRIQADTAAKMHSLNTLDLLNAYVQQEAGLNAQRIATGTAKINNDYSVKASAAQTRSQLANERGNLARASTQVESDYTQRVGSADVQSAQVSEQISQALDQLSQQLTVGERQRAAEASRFRLASSSDELSTNTSALDQVAEQLANLLELDRESAYAVVQNLNATNLADLAKAVGLRDINFAETINQMNEGLVSSQEQFALQESDRTYDLQNRAISIAQNQALAGLYSQVNSANTASAATQALNAVNQQAGVATANSVNDSLTRQVNSYRGAGFLDYVNLGLNAYSNFSPLFNRTPTVPSPNVVPAAQNILSSIPY